MTTAPKRAFRFSFSLRSFFIGLTLFSLWLGFHMRSTNLQKDAVKRIREYGGWVRYDYQMPNGAFDPKASSFAPSWLRSQLGDDFFYSVVEVNCVYSEDSGTRSDNANVTAAPLELLNHLPNVEGLFLKESQANDENLRHVAGLKHLKTFMAWDASQLGDAGVAHLRHLHKLTNLHVSEGQLTDRSLAIFAEMPQLEMLSLQFNQFTDEGVRKLESLKHLQLLWVCGRSDRRNDISDDSLSFLLTLPKLTSLGVQRTFVTKDFSAKLKQRFPKCMVAENELKP